MRHTQQWYADLAKRQGFTVAWDYDDIPWDADVPWDGPVYVALLHDRQGHIVASLCSIAMESTDDPYARVVAAELALEAL